MRRIALYSHDTMGLGHLRRNLLIAHQLASSNEPVAILLITGLRQASAFTLPSGVDCLSLPSLRKKDGGYTSRSLGISTARLIAFRSRIIRGAIEEFDPDVMIVDKVPRGVLRELDATLAFLRKAGRTHCVLGLRDVLDDPAIVQAEWRHEENEQAIDDFYDAVWVYGDRNVYDMVREYGFSDTIVRKLYYTGYLDPRLRLQSSTVAHDTDGGSAPVSPLGSLAICVVGGGEDGARLASAFAQSQFPPDMESIILAGPFMPTDLHERLCHVATENSRLRVLRFTDEPVHLLRRADRVIAMGGYNTICELLCHRKRALVVPRVKPRREQWIRANRMKNFGLLDVLHPDQLTPGRLTDWLASDSPSVPPNPTCIDFNGLKRLTTLLDSLCWDSGRRRRRPGHSTQEAVSSAIAPRQICPESP